MIQYTVDDIRYIILLASFAEKQRLIHDGIDYVTNCRHCFQGKEKVREYNLKKCMIIANVDTKSDFAHVRRED